MDVIKFMKVACERVKFSVQMQVCWERSRSQNLPFGQCSSFQHPAF